MPFAARAPPWTSLPLLPLPRQQQSLRSLADLTLNPHSKKYNRRGTVLSKLNQCMAVCTAFFDRYIVL